MQIQALVTQFFNRIIPLFRPVFPLFNSSGLGLRLAKATGWSLAGTVLARGLTLVASVLVSRILGAQHYGALGMIGTTAGMFGAFAGFGLGTTATRYLAQYRSQSGEQAGQLIGFVRIAAYGTSAIAATVYLLASPWLAERTLSAGYLAVYLRLSTSTLVFSSLAGVETGILAGFEDFRAIARVSVIAGVTSFPLQVIGAYFWGLEGSVLARGIGVGLNWVLAVAAVKRAAQAHRVEPVWWPIPVGEAKILWRFSMPLLLSTNLITPISWVGSALLAKQPGGYSELGAFSAAANIQTVITTLGGLVSGAVLPMLSDRSLYKGNDQYNSFLHNCSYITIAIITPISLLFIGFSPAIMRVYQPEFSERWLVLVVLVVSAILQSVQAPFVRHLQASDQNWIIVVLNLIWGLFFYLTSLATIGRFGATGLAISYFIAFVAYGFAMALWIIKGTKN